MPAKRLRTYLDENHIRYVAMSHSQAYTAQEIAAASHVPGKAMAKTVMVKLDGKMAMVVVPALHKIDLEVLKRGSHSSRTELATEAEFKLLFPDCEPGAMPPFGNLYGLPVFVEEGLTANPEIAFNAGSHTEILKMDFADFQRLVKPTLLRPLQHA
ncbi:MAG TPA: YbaK/EbsC family protein [Candidatus Saccharimonadales bacterium]|nr:YbaK/EbsC family protein [Candidatus Saccharimonadales bacterium]